MASAKFRTRKKLLDHKIRGLRLLARALGLKIAGGPVEADELYELALGNTPELPKEVFRKSDGTRDECSTDDRLDFGNQQKNKKQCDWIDQTRNDECR
jgi:hypothetical protein